MNNIKFHKVKKADKSPWKSAEWQASESPLRKFIKARGHSLLEDTEEHESITEMSTMPAEPVLRLLEPNDVIALPSLQNAMDIVSEQVKRCMMTIEHLRLELNRVTQERDFFRENLSQARGVFQFMQGMGTMDLDRPNIPINPPTPAPTMGIPMPYNPQRPFTTQPSTLPPERLYPPPMTVPVHQREEMIRHASAPVHQHEELIRHASALVHQREEMIQHASAPASTMPPSTIPPPAQQYPLPMAVPVHQPHDNAHASVSPSSQSVRQGAATSTYPETLDIDNTETSTTDNNAAGVVDVQKGDDSTNKGPDTSDEIPDNGANTGEMNQLGAVTSAYIAPTFTPFKEMMGESEATDMDKLLDEQVKAYNAEKLQERLGENEFDGEDPMEMSMFGEEGEVDG
jgi:hypothetical protein